MEGCQTRVRWTKIVSKRPYGGVALRPPFDHGPVVGVVHHDPAVRHVADIVVPHRPDREPVAVLTVEVLDEHLKT